MDSGTLRTASVLLAPWAHLDLKVCLAWTGNPDRQGLQARTAMPAHKARKACLVLAVRPVRRVLRGSRVRRDPPGRRGRPVRRGLLDRRARLVLKVRRVNRARLVRMGKMVRRVRRARLVLKVHRVNRARRASAIALRPD